MAESDFFEVTVKEAAHNDASRGIARLSVDVMKKLNLVSGDVIEIVGKKNAAAIVWPGFAEDIGFAILRIDGSIRANANAGIDEKVKIRKSEAVYATKVVIQPTQATQLVGGEQYLSRVLRGRSVVEGQTLRVDIIGNSVTFVIVRVSPRAIAIVSDDTEIELKNEPFNPEEGKREISSIQYEDIGGLERELQLVREMIELPLRHPELFEKLGIKPPKGVLFYGPPGTGKTLIAKAVANEVDAHFSTLSGPEIMSKFYGDSEKALRDKFHDAEENAPSIIFIDEIDAIAPKREDVQGEVERRIVAQLLALMDGLAGRGQVVVIAATNLPNSIDPALRRGGRFDREIEIGIPDKKGRLEIFQVHTRGVPLAKDVDIAALAETTFGFVGADIALLVKEAAMNAIRKIIPLIDINKQIPAEVIEQLRITKNDFDTARKIVQPSALREVLIEIPDVAWEDIAGLDQTKDTLIKIIEGRLRYPKIFEKLDYKPPRGILLFGPPGTGKTLLAKGIASKRQLNFISVKGPELLSKGVGDSEKHVREAFRKARQSAPCIIFFDEIDALFPKRGTVADNTHVTESVLSQFLTELDGIEELKEVFVIGATNRPDLLDPALLRPGRLEKHLYIPPPDEAARKAILATYLRGIEGVLDPDVNTGELAAQTRFFVGADLEALVREAKAIVIDEVTGDGSTGEEKIPETVRITRQHFDAALEQVKGTLDGTDFERYEQKSWDLLYAKNRREILYQAVGLINQVEYLRGKTTLKAGIIKQADELRDLVYWQRRSFDEIRERTEKLRKALEACTKSPD
ncbi:AAA family ATPase, CDC48 subfamily [Methanoregula boonei 6A8]|jgi:transitional endoplasmic reticulum ATPase|uniref:AAA family ATPase, CDC48 subfamily n=1 Tax=Methanoregula boonei (strain DSM 21154 / JCM 14090 / 6A8) TaxID=456442 RepID=A7I8Q2_METB6|nr:CDC48 family AAA ATPase [Methanoregula boonei]ABS56113.1 AAA family ATPase, CDC48 subfamily [Methanoregula boonei 6A8]